MFCRSGAGESMKPYYIVKSEYELPPERPFAFMTAGGNFSTPDVFHWHDCLELNLVRGGRGVNYIGTKEYRLSPGQLYLINNVDTHIAVTDGSLDMQIIIFDPALLGQCGPGHYQYLLPFYPTYPEASNLAVLQDADMKKVMCLFDEIEREWESCGRGNELFVRAKLLELLAVLYRGLKAEDGKNAMARRREYEKILPSIEYINTHLAEPMPLAALASVCGMSRTYFSGCFKKAMEMNLTTYLEKARISRACMLLATTSLPVTEVALESGFSSLSSFNAIFKKSCGKTPGDYRRSIFD